MALQHLPTRLLTTDEEIDWPRPPPAMPPCDDAEPGQAVVQADGSIAGIGHREADALLRPKVVFNAAG